MTESPSLPQPRLPSGTEFDQLLDALRLARPWALVAAEPTASGTSAPEPTSGLERVSADDDQAWMSLTDVLRAHAAGGGDRVALADGTRTVSYRELDRQTDALAAALLASGVTRGDVVAVILDRSVEFVQAVFAVWKAGAAYFPLIPGHPVAWRERQVRRAGAAAVVSATADEAMPGLPHVPVGRALAEVGPAPAPPPPGPADLAYVAATSGSTGAPRLIAVEHRGLIYAARTLARVAGPIGPGKRVLHWSTPLWDGVLFEFLLGLVSGARLEIMTGPVLAGGELAEFLQRRRITHAGMTPALLATVPPDGLPDLEVMICGGDAYRPETARRWFGKARLINCYGPAEATVLATTHVLTRDDVERGQIPIGRPADGYQVVVTDDEDRALPPGQAGEIRIRGVGVARGYLGDPGETARRFVRVAGGAGAEREYRTGDLGRMSADGVLDFLGRVDREVKIRGVRLDLEQIERELAALPGVQDAVAIARDQQLTGYLQPAPGARPDPARLRRDLAARLPGHMVPSVLMLVDEWPVMSASYKVDRSRLPAPEPAPAGSGLRPATTTEATLAEIAADLLGMERLGSQDVFAELGGHSLLASQFLARAQAALGVRAGLSAVLGGATIAELAACLDAKRDGNDTVSGAGSSAGPGVPVRSGQPGPVPAGRPDQPPDSPIPVVPSHAQERAWLMHQLAPDALAYNTQSAIRLAGDLDAAALRASLAGLIQRHEVLRSHFWTTAEGELRCAVTPPWEPELPVLDLAGGDPLQAAAAFDAAVREAVLTPFRLGHDRLIRWRLIKTAAREHVLIQVEHHAVHDGWSFNVLFHELIAGYADTLRHGAPRRPAPPIGYYDYARWQRDWLESPEGMAHRQYWRQALAGAPPVLPLPRAPGRTAQRRFRGATPRMELGERLTLAVHDLAQSEGATLFITLITGFFTVLHRYTGATDLLVGTGTASRRWQQAEDLVGMLVNTVVLRGNLDGDPTFRELLHRMRAACLAAYDHQDVPFDVVVADAGGPRGDVLTLVQAMFSIHDSPQRTWEEVPLEITCAGLGNGSAKFDLNVVAVPRYEKAGHISARPGHVVTVPASDGPVRPAPASALTGITLSWEFDTDVLDEPFIEGMMRAYREIMLTATAAPDTRLSELPLLTDRTRGELIALGRGPDTDAGGLLLHELVLAQAAKRPDSTAVAADRTLTYARLAEEAHQVAAWLIREGARRGDLVGILLDRSADQITAMLGVLCAGAAYVPLDPAHPPPRLAWLIADSGARLVVTSPTLAGLLPDVEADVELLPGPADNGPGDRGPRPALPSGDPGDAAYVMYTSGSTGTPKGVRIDHRSVVARLARPDFLDLRPGDSISHLAPVGFDASVLEIWAPLLHGATLHIPPGDYDLVTALRYLAERQVSHTWLVAPVFNHLATTSPELLGPFAHVLTGGDVVSADAVRAALDAGVQQVTNGYGPTETTIFATAYQAAPGALHGPAVPIGRPVANTSVMVVDSDLRLVPPGVAGELLIGGPGVGHGYLGQPALTARQFLPHPDAGGGDGRFYRSGDLVRWDSAGLLQFLGRLDDQVKVNGVRVELAEARAALLTRPEVADVAVVTDTEGAGGPGRQLIGYIRPAAGASVDAATIRAALAGQVPTFLVPQQLVIVTDWPLTPAGKLDVTALPGPAAEEVRPVPRSPQTRAERELAAILEELLGRPGISLDDDFFELGGHSLLATQYAARATTVLGRRVSLAAVLRHPTMVGLIAATAADPAPARPITARGRWPAPRPRAGGR
jgi:amino acid adenylation domain-containing protein